MWIVGFVRWSIAAVGHSQEWLCYLVALDLLRCWTSVV